MELSAKLISVVSESIKTALYEYENNVNTTNYT